MGVKVGFCQPDPSADDIRYYLSSAKNCGVLLVPETV